METPEAREKIKWYYTQPAVILAVIVAGPFALPLVWKSPALKRWNKILLTAVIIILTVWTIKLSVDIFQIVKKHLDSYRDILYF